MSKHTPGPFTVHGPSLGIGPNDDGGDYAIVDSDRKIIAEVIHLVGPGNDVRPAKANAELFAAAPDLLVACEAAGEWAAGYPIGGIDDAIIAEDILRQCNAAIAKARGEAR